MESEVWAPLTDAQTAARRDGLSMVTMTLGRGRFKDVDLFCKQRLDLELVAMRETEYFAQLSAFYAPIRVMVWVTALLIATGGLLGGLNTMYAAFASRVREIGTLQSLGFGRGAIAVSLLQESLLAACAGALGATALALAVLDGLAISFSAGAFELLVDESVLAAGLLAAVLLGAVGAFVPAWRCLRMDIPQALRSA
jgi:putative ABC transport system permease protein